MILLPYSCTHLPSLPLVQQVGWDAPVSVGTAVAWGCLCGCQGSAHGELCVPSGTVCVEMCIIPCIYLCTKEKRKKRSYCSCSLFFVEWVGGWDLGGEDPSCSRDAGACVVQKEAWGVVRSSCVSTSPALPPGTRLWLTGSPSPSGLSLQLAEASKALLLKAGGWGAACTEAGMGEDAWGSGVGGEGSFAGSLGGRCHPNPTVPIAIYMAAPAVSIQEPVS